MAMQKSTTLSGIRSMIQYLTAFLLGSTFNWQKTENMFTKMTYEAFNMIENAFQQPVQFERIKFFFESISTAGYTGPKFFQLT